MCVCIHVYIHVCTYEYVYIHTYTYIHTHIYTQTRTYIYSGFPGDSDGGKESTCNAGDLVLIPG